MSFHFKKVRLKDWLVYGGVTDIELPAYEDNRNLVVVNGQNGFGKTSLLQALAFVFDGRASKSDLRGMWNETAAASKEGSVEVGIEFSHSGRACSIVRGANFKPWGEDTAVTPWVKLFVDGEEETEQVEDKISQMLPRDCLEFIFFDGAEISRYAQKQQTQGVHEAIEKVLGIPAVRNLRDDLLKVVGDVEDEQEELLSQSAEAESLLAEVESLKDDEDGYVARRTELVDKKASLEATKSELEKEAEDIDVIERERQELKDKKRRRADLDERRGELNSEIQTAISQTPIAMLVPALRQVVAALQMQTEPSPRRENHSAKLQVLRDILENDECVCRRDIDEDVRRTLTKELERVQKQLDSFPKRSGAASNDLLELATIIKTLEARDSDHEDLFDRRAGVIDQLEELDTDIRRLEGELEGHELANINELYMQLAQLKQQIHEHSRSIQAIDENLDRTRSTLQQKQRQLDEIGAGDEQARGVTQTLEEARKIHGSVCDLVKELVEAKRGEIETAASRVFTEITNKPDEYEGIRVNSDYSLEVVRRDGSVVENSKLSAGEKEVVAYSFITALNLASVDPAPFVMDTPFGHLDSGHRHGLLRSLPSLKVQAVLLATDRDLPADERDAIDSFIAKEFTLVRNQRKAITTIEEG